MTDEKQMNVITNSLGGRPVIFDADMKECFLEYLCSGLSNAEACAATGIARPTLHSHLSRDPEFRERYEMELDLVVRAFDEFKDIFARKIIEDEMLWRELEDRYGDYFEGGMGADAIKSLIAKLDFDANRSKWQDQWRDIVTGK